MPELLCGRAAGFRLIENKGAWPIRHRHGDFLATVHGQAVQKDCPWPGRLHQLFRDRIGPHCCHAGGSVALTHADPDIGVQHIGSGGSFVGVVRDQYLGFGLFGGSAGASNNLWVWLIAGWCRHADVHACAWCQIKQGVRHVVAIAKIRQPHAGRTAEMLFYREGISKCLHRV